MESEKILETPVGTTAKENNHNKLFVMIAMLVLLVVVAGAAYTIGNITGKQYVDAAKSTEHRITPTIRVEQKKSSAERYLETLPCRRLVNFLSFRHENKNV